MKKAYVRFISHELRTPLNSVFMGMQLLLDQIPEDTQEPVELERKETLMETQSACSAALDILNELLLFDKLETGALVLNKLTVPVPELVEDSIKMFSVQMKEKSLKLVITNNDESILTITADIDKPVDLSSATIYGDRPASLLPSLYKTDEVYVDKNKVVQVIRNVVSNAIKFTPAFGVIKVNVLFAPSLQDIKRRKSGGSSRSLSKSTKGAALITGIDDAVAADPLPSTAMEAHPEPVPGELVIAIKDSGAGISEANQKKLFNQVVQFHPELLQNGGGSGLGMCISKGIMDMHGGSISVYSAGEGHGSVFTLRLPMLRHLSGPSLPSLYVPTIAIPSVNAARPLISTSLAPTPRLYGITPRPFDIASISTPMKDLLFASVQALSTTSAKTTSLISERSLRFLVVDDSKMNRKMLCRLLRNQGHVCVEAEDGVQAVAMMTLIANTPRQEDSTTADGLEKVTGRTTEDATVLDFKSVYDAILMDFM